MKAVVHFHNSTGWGGVFPIKTRESVVEQSAVTQHEPKVVELEPLLTENEACAYLKTSKRNLFCWRAAGLIPYIKIGRAVRFRASDVERALSTLNIETNKQTP
jgi:excisionase family DNA binding protein